MSFRIFASGSGRFHFERDNCIDDSDIDMVDLVSKFQTMEPTWMGAVTTGIDIVQPSAGIIDLMQSMATREFLHNLSNAVSFLAMCSGSSNGWIAVSVRQTHIAWPDTVAFDKYEFYPGDSPGTEFIRKIRPILSSTDTANWGVMRMIGEVLARYSNHIDSSATPMINIQITS